MGAVHMVAAVAEANPVGKKFSVLKDAKKALEMERRGDEVVWSSSIMDLTETLRNRSGINNVVVVEDHDGDHRTYAYELGAPVLLNPLDVISALKGGGKVILYMGPQHTSNDYYKAIEKITADGTIKQRGFESAYIHDAAGKGTQHKFILFAAYDKLKAKAASKRQKARIVKQGLIDYNGLQSVLGVFAGIIREHFKIGTSYLVGPLWTPKERLAVYKTIPFLAKRVDQLGEGSKRFTGEINTYHHYQTKRSGRWIRIPYAKWILLLRQYRRGLLTTKNGTKTIKSNEFDSLNKVWNEVKKKVPVSGKPAREFGKWLDSEIRACIQYLRSKKRGGKK